MIETQGLTKRYGSFTAVQDLTFTADSGEILGFLGPNGAGKTTTMRMLTGFMPPTEGSAKVAGFDVMTESLQVRQHVGYLPETVPLYPDMTVRGYVEYVANMRGVPQAKARTKDVLQSVGMSERREGMIRNLSKGMRQRVGLAQALVHDPAVLILDEPTIGLDPLQTLEVRDMVRDFASQRTVMFSTHILSEAEQVCDRVIIIDQGQIVAMDQPARLRDRLQSGGRLFVRLDKNIDSQSVIKALQAVSGAQSAEVYQDGYTVTARPGVDIRARIAEAIGKQGWALLELRPLAMSLEDIFIELTARDTDKK